MRSRRKGDGSRITGKLSAEEVERREFGEIAEGGTSLWSGSGLTTSSFLDMPQHQARCPAPSKLAGVVGDNQAQGWYL